MEKQNAELYWENYRIMLENERLRKKAIELNKENEALRVQMKERRAAGQTILAPDTQASTSTANQLYSNNPGEKKM